MNFIHIRNKYNFETFSELISFIIAGRFDKKHTISVYYSKINSYGERNIGWKIKKATEIYQTSRTTEIEVVNLNLVTRKSAQ